MFHVFPIVDEEGNAANETLVEALRERLKELGYNVPRKTDWHQALTIWEDRDGTYNKDILNTDNPHLQHEGHIQGSLRKLFFTDYYKVVEPSEIEIPLGVNSYIKIKKNSAFVKIADNLIHIDSLREVIGKFDGLNPNL